MADAPPQLAQVLAQLEGPRGARPFGPDARVYEVRGKMTALVPEGRVDGAGEPRRNPKHAPERSEVLRATHPEHIWPGFQRPGFQRPGFHMNTRHWDTGVVVGRPDDALVARSCELVPGALAERERGALDGGGR